MVVRVNNQDLKEEGERENNFGIICKLKLLYYREIYGSKACEYLTYNLTISENNSLTAFIKKGLNFDVTNNQGKLICSFYYPEMPKITEFIRDSKDYIKGKIWHIAIKDKAETVF